MAESGATEDEEPQCYCGATQWNQNMIRCQGCNKWFHPTCLKSGTPSPLAGDIFYNLRCTSCDKNGEEDCTRMKLQWLQVVMLTLYNLQLSERGKCGFYRWKEHICSFIDKHWNTFFGPTRKKTMTWYGTVAGTLSSNCPQYFKSGAGELKEHGWWSLSEVRPPTLDTLTNARPMKRQKLEVKEPVFKVEGLRTRRSKTSFESAMELKAKRAMTMEAKEMRKQKTGTDKNSSVKVLLSNSLEDISSMAPISRAISKESIAFSDESSNPLMEVKREIMEPDFLDQDSSMSMSSVKSDSWYTLQDLQVGDKVPEALLMGDEEELDSDLEVDPCSITPPETPSSPVAGPSDGLPRMEEILATLESKTSTELPSSCRSTSPPSVHPTVIVTLPVATETTSTDGLDHTHVTVKEEVVQTSPIVSHSEPFLCPPVSGETASNTVDLDSDSDSDNDVASQTTSEGSSECVRPKRKITQDTETQLKPPEPKYMAMSVYEEKQLLQRLTALGDAILKDPAANRLKRKLVVRQLKRERSLPLFNLDARLKQLMGNQMDGTMEAEVDPSLNPHGVPTVRCAPGDYRVLDRYQRQYFASVSDSQQPLTFLNRLVGTEDDQLQSTCSPYTARMLKPFIRRDYESRPMKMKLLQEVQAYPYRPERNAQQHKLTIAGHQNDPEWKLPAPFPIDYCYVRPQHIASVNALCREFFWPGIDMSECLQYPDFSCVVLYRKFVIGFAFLVPDVKYNEAYISFIFTHPEWRGAGIGTFVLYHLIQTCMGKDVTLHVSASNPAMVLYQKFGFKPEEFILDFYDKYFPVDSKECRHAFFLRLRR